MSYSQLLPLPPFDDQLTCQELGARSRNKAITLLEDELGDSPHPIQSALADLTCELIGKSPLEVGSFCMVVYCSVLHDTIRPCRMLLSKRVVTATNLVSASHLQEWIKHLGPQAPSPWDLSWPIELVGHWRRAHNTKGMLQVRCIKILAGFVSRAIEATSGGSQ